MTPYYNIFKSLQFLFFLALAFFCFSTLVSGDETTDNRVVGIIGTSNVYKGDTAKARECAISNSLTSALGIVVSDLAPFESLADKFKILNEILYEHTDDFILDYKVLTEAVSAKIYRVMVESTISTSKVKKMLSDVGVITDGETLPRVLFLISEQLAGDTAPRYWWGEGFNFNKNVSESAMAKVIIKKGFLVVDYELRPHDTELSAISYTPNPDNRQAVATGRLLYADIVITGSAVARKTSNTMGEHTKSFSGNVAARILKTDTGEEIAKTDKTFIAISDDDVTGSREALLIAGTEAGEDLSTKIITLWNKKKIEPVILEILVTGTKNLAGFTTLRRFITSMPQVKDVKTRGIRSNETNLAIKIKGNTKEFADALILKDFDSFGINIIEAGENRLNIKIVNN